ncbi:MAG: CapA family protein [Acidobacteriota bacterium]|nr:CapA family protein [Blastocatellia bacterium]MDW8412569.1 CapA family protein [Acidobacteriota bacterium]
MKARVMAVGDIIIHQDQINAAYDEVSHSYSFSSCFEEVRELFSQADLVIGNLETTFAGKEKGYTGYPRFNAPEILAKELKLVGFDVLTTANNHAADYGEAGIFSTLDRLDEAGLLHTGTARSQKERNTPLIVTRNKIRIAITAYTYGTNDIPVAEEYMVNLIDYEKVALDVAACRAAGADVILSMLHIGTEYSTCPDETQKAAVEKFQSLGIDIVLGSHPHIVQQPILSPDASRYAIFSMGNFISNQRGDGKDIGVIVDLTLDVSPDKQLHITPNYHLTYVHKWTENGRLRYLIRLLKEECELLRNSEYLRLNHTQILTRLRKG